MVIAIVNQNGGNHYRTLGLWVFLLSKILQEDIRSKKRKPSAQSTKWAKRFMDISSIIIMNSSDINDIPSALLG